MSSLHSVLNIDEQERQKLYGVWFSKPEDATEGEGGVLFDAQDEPIIPDLVRVADLIPNFEPIGLLEQVSEGDLLETDLYVFRESTGELVVEKLNFARNGDLAETPRNGVDEQSSLGYFELTVPGRDAGHSFRNVYRNRKLYNDYEDWQASLGIQASLQGYESDSLRVGEPLTLVVLNRATGYIGTASTSVVDVSERSINISLPDIRLFPPQSAGTGGSTVSGGEGFDGRGVPPLPGGQRRCCVDIGSIRERPYPVVESRWHSASQ